MDFGLLARRVAGVVVLGALCWAPPAHAGEDDVLLEFHFTPVPHAQIAIWLETGDGTFINDVFVTQATGSLGIGNRPGRWDFLSSWRFPYGPRPNVLPVWAHRRGKTYPQLVFHDSDPSDQDSLGWHESTSSPEPYYCRPLAPEEHDTISVDTMTCPSPSVFQTDKGRLSSTDSVYPPRNDLTEFEEGHDHADVKTLSALNDLDAVTGATPTGGQPELVTAILSEDLAQEPVTAWIEVNLEHDGNPDWDFAREDDHFVDPRLSSYGIAYRGQPSVVYRVEIDPRDSGFAGTDAYAGYGDEKGESGTLNPPDASISTEGGSGADRLALYTLNDETFRFGVFSHGPGSRPPDPDEPDWGGCSIADLPPMEPIELEALEFDTVRVHFTVPTMPDGTNVRNLRVFYRAGSMPLTDDNSSSAIQAVPGVEDCSGPLVSGERVWCDLHELFGNQDYQIGVRLEDACSNSSPISTGAVTTPLQEFAQVDGFCFVATAAYGANWADRVRLLRYFRDDTLKTFAIGAAFVRFYYSNSPPIANFIARFELARLMARMTLAPFTEIVRGFMATRTRRAQ
ncbi:MAG: CFI-box-CTERM domain-containing protein [Myxococcota bacterium]